MTYQDILKINIPERFGLIEDDGWSSDLDFVIEQLESKESHIRYDNGCSKFVIFLNENEVIKIPFNGSYCWDSDDEEDYFREFETSDYCKVEADVYQEAIAEGLSHFFAKTILAGFTEKTHYPVYLSERVIPMADRDFDSIFPSEDSLNKARMISSPITLNWLACAIDYYGEEEVIKLIDFIKEQRIGDFHSGNVGFRKDGAPVLLDYSGYHENY